MFSWMRRAHAPPRRQEQRIRVSETLVGYPVYEIPEWNPETKSLREAHLEYVRLFFAEKDRRLEALGRFLAKFDVDMSLDDTGAMAVSAWLPLYVDLLVDKLEDEGTQSAYSYLESAWTGPLLGLNTIFDLGVYFGECILHRNSKLQWQPARGPEPRNIAHPIFGVRHRVFDPVRDIYSHCRNVRAVEIQQMRGMRRPHISLRDPFDPFPDDSSAGDVSFARVIVKKGVHVAAARNANVLTEQRYCCTA